MFSKIFEVQNENIGLRVFVISDKREILAFSQSQ